MDWTNGPDTVAAAAAVIALVGSFIAFLRSVAAGRKADRAEERAVAAEKRANEARDRAADALEQIAETQTPKPFVQWTEPVQDRRSHYIVRNVGNATAVAAQLTREGDGIVAPDEELPEDIEPGVSLGFTAMRTSAGRPTARIEWQNADGERQRVLRRI